LDGAQWAVGSRRRFLRNGTAEIPTVRFLRFYHKITVLFLR